MATDHGQGGRLGPSPDRRTKLIRGWNSGEHVSADVPQLANFRFWAAAVNSSMAEMGRKADVAARPVVALQRASSSISASAQSGVALKKLIFALVNTPRARPRRNDSELRIHDTYATLS